MTILVTTGADGSVRFSYEGSPTGSDRVRTAHGARIKWHDSNTEHLKMEPCKPAIIESFHVQTVPLFEKPRMVVGGSSSSLVECRKIVESASTSRKVGCVCVWGGGWGWGG